MPNQDADNQKKWSPLNDAIQALRDGHMVIVVDSEERENEGDFICAAESITPEMVNFMLKVGRGELCSPMTAEIAERLRFNPIVDSENNTAPHKTPFQVPIDHRNAGTGVSPNARALTLNELANPDARPEDFLRPGHIKPLKAKDGGVLRRAGHTEATIDLLKMAGLTPVGALIEIASQTGLDMAGYEELKQISDQYEIPIISIEELIRHRRISERLVSREAEVTIPTAHYGSPKIISYKVEHETQEPLALVWGDLSSVDAPLVRMHSSCFTGDLIESLRCDCGDQLHMAMSMIHREGTGAVVYLPQEGRGIGLTAKLKAYQLQDEGYDTVEANHKLGFKTDMRDYMIGLQILKDLGLSQIRLLTNNPKKSGAFIYPGFDLKLVEQVPIVAPPEKERERYLETKRAKMGHLLPPLDQG
jgi:3,4-dihydroxy 2-butanone 4-phosphate synthase/GTP cyclohydrolase II